MSKEMNERIKEITGQVLDELVPETWVALGYDKIKEIQYRTAELVIKECMEIADTYQNRGGNCYVDNMIRQHFGLKRWTNEFNLVWNYTKIGQIISTI